MSSILHSSKSQKEYEIKLFNSIHYDMCMNKVIDHSTTWDSEEILKLILANIQYMPEADSYYRQVLEGMAKDFLRKLDITDEYRTKLKIIGFKI